MHISDKTELTQEQQQEQEEDMKWIFMYYLKN